MLRVYVAGFSVQRSFVQWDTAVACITHLNIWDERRKDYRIDYKYYLTSYQPCTSCPAKNVTRLLYLSQFPLLKKNINVGFCFVKRGD